MSYLALEIATEVAWQIGDSLQDSPRAESRWLIADTAQEIINSGLITQDSVDIDEIISEFLIKKGIK